MASLKSRVSSLERTHVRRCRDADRRGGEEDHTSRLLRQMGAEWLNAVIRDINRRGSKAPIATQNVSS